MMLSAFTRNVVFVFIQVLVEVVPQVILDVYLVLGCRDDHVVVLDDASLIDLRHVVKKSPRRLYDTHARAGLRRAPNGFLVGHLDGSQEIDRVVDAVQDLDRLRQVVMIHVVRREGRKVGCRVVLASWDEVGPDSD